MDTIVTAGPDLAVLSEEQMEELQVWIEAHDVPVEEVMAVRHTPGEEGESFGTLTFVLYEKDEHGRIKPQGRRPATRTLSSPQQLDLPEVWFLVAEQVVE